MILLYLRLQRFIVCLPHPSFIVSHLDTHVFNAICVHGYVARGGTCLLVAKLCP